jgi:hypothetical protein
MEDDDMTTKLIRGRLVTGWLVTMLVPLGAVLAGAVPAAEPPIASPVGSGAVFVWAPQLPGSSNADAPWLYENLITYAPAGTCPLKPADDTRPAELETKAEPALPVVQVPATVQNLRRADGR